MQTVFAGEADYDVARRVRDAVRPLRSEDASLTAGEDARQAEAIPGSVPLSYYIQILNGGSREDVMDMMPRRPEWGFQVSSGRLHFREQKAFQSWLARVRERLMQRGGYAPVYEQNLQVWRQLWRVLERADVVVLVLDARHPLLHLPPALYLHVAATLQKPLVLILNKMDMVDTCHVVQWARHLEAALPGVSAVVGYNSHSPNADHVTSREDGPASPASEAEAAAGLEAAHGLRSGRHALLEVREPFTAVRWLAEHSNAAPLTEQLKVKPLTEYDSELLQFAPGDVRAVEAAEAAGSGRPMPWSPMSLCAQYARVRGFMSRGGVDAELAGKTIVQRTLDSKIAWRVASPKGDPDYPTVRGIRHGNDVASSGDQANAEHVSDAEYCSEEDEADEDEPAGRTRKSGFEALMVMDDEARD
eukprot:gene18828-22494_t